MSFLLFEKVCLYDAIKDETVLYGQHTGTFKSIVIEDAVYSVVQCNNRPDFYIKLKGKIAELKRIVFNETVELENLQLVFPFEGCDLQLHAGAAIISTICKDYSHRLDEWIQYNLKLGFSGIVVFNNDENKTNGLNESLNNCVQTHLTADICKKYKGKVWCIDMPYSKLPGGYWADIQRITLHIGVNAFRNKCRNIALIDADEFIYIPKHTGSIEDYLQKYSTITMLSNLLTNKNEDDILDNNILELAKYVGEDKYTKTILHTTQLVEHEFVVTPHTHPTQMIMSKEDIIHYHCWMNTRCKYNAAMPMIEFLSRGPVC